MSSHRQPAPCLNRFIAALALWVLCGCWCLCVQAQPMSKEALYLKSTKLYQQKRYKDAVPWLKRLVTSLETEQRKQKPNTRQWHGLTIGLCDVLYKLADSQWRAGNRAMACHSLTKLSQKLGSLPPKWQRWSVLPQLPKRAKSGQQRLQQDCPKVPSVIVFQTTPSDANVSVQAPDKSWRPIKSRTLKTTAREVTVRISAPKYQSTEKKVSVPQWSQIRQNISLTPAAIVVRLPRKRPVVRRPIERRKLIVVIQPPKRPVPPKPPPFYQTWWFWTITGVVVVGGSAAIIIAVTPPTYQLEGNTPGEPFRNW